MKNCFTCLVMLAILLLVIHPAQAQDLLNPNRVLWSAPLSASTIKTVVDTKGNTWALSGSNTFQVVDGQGKVSWTKTLSVLTVADFAIDSQGQLLLVGLPATGQPVLEKYDVTQTLAWRNVLDSLSNVPGQAGNLSIALTKSGSGLVLGQNARTDRKLSYYFFRADGRIQQMSSVQSATQSRITPIRPVNYNTNEILFGFNQPDDLEASPTFYRLKADSLAVPTANAEQQSFWSYVRDEDVNVARSARTRSSSQLLANGQAAYGIFSSRYTRLNESSTTLYGYGLVNFTYAPLTVNGPKTQPSIQYTSAYQTDLATISGAMSSLLDTRGNLYTVQTTSSGSNTNLVIDQYDLKSQSNGVGFFALHLINSTKVGTVNYAAADASRQTNRLSLLASNADGSLLISGTTTGTLTIGKSTFTGTPEAPAHYLMTISAENPRQNLSVDQIKWASTLPPNVRKVIANVRQQTWVQLADSTFRYYDSQGKPGWEKKLAVDGIRETGADLRGNLYTVGNDAIYAFDSTGNTLWKLTYRPKGQFNYEVRLAIRPNGGGVFLEQLSSGSADQVDFDEKGNLLAAKRFITNTGTYFTIGTIPLQLDDRLIFAVNFSPVSAAGTSGTYLLDYKNPAGSNWTMLGTTGRAKWTGAGASNIVVLANSYDYSSFDFSGKPIFRETNTPRVNTIGLAKTQAVNPSGTLFTLTTSFRAETAATTSYDLVMNQYSPSLDLRNTTRLGTFTLANGQTDITSLSIVQAYADGSLLVSGMTNGTLTIGANTFTGSSATPARFLTLVNTVLAQVTGPALAICAGTNATIKARYKGFLDQAPIIQLADSKGNIVSPALTLPLNASALADTTLNTLSLPIPATLATGTYQVRTQLGTLLSPWTSFSVTAKPMALTATQQGDELVSATATAGTYQWYDGQNNPVTGATDARFKPQTAGSYYLVNTANGCASAPSNTITFVITALEPAIAVEVYPNPVTERLLVRWPKAATGARIRLLNTQGRVMQDVPRQGDVTDVPTQGLSGGLVLVQLQADGQPVVVRKVLIQK